MNVPSCYSGELADAYERGWQQGRGIACHNVPKLGAKLWIGDMGHVVIDAENIREAHQALCFEAESNSRQYSPFEFTAHEFNESDDADELWDAFEAGASDAIFADLATYTDEDYGIESEEIPVKLPPPIPTT